MKLLIKNAKIVQKGNVDIITDILVENGIIISIEKNIDEIGCEVLDAQKKYVIPGVIDAHTHMRDPGLCHKEDFITGSRAAARGGVTTFLDMPNTLPLTSNEEELKKKMLNCMGRSYVDYGFHFGGVKSDNSSEIKKIVSQVASTKIFLNESTGDMLIENSSTIENLFDESKIITVHAEGDKVDEAIRAAVKFRKPLYLCHLSTEEEVAMLKKGKTFGTEIYGEVTPHHLFLTASHRERSERDNALLRMKPELKNDKDREALWKALAEGIIDTVGTDHAPHTLEEKFSKTTFGVPGIENSLELMLKGVSEKKISMERLIEVMCSNPARIFNISKKGKIEIGYYGDFVILDMENHTPFRDEEVISKCGWTPFHGIERGGKVETTILRGNIIYNRGVFSSELLGNSVQFS
ncbi:MAG: dihydroorotase [Fusobacteriaceae bacterium]